MIQPLATVSASRPRRFLAVATLGGLGVFLLWIALARTPGSGLWTIYLLLVGIVMLLGAQRLWAATARSLILTNEGIHDDRGRLLCKISDVVAVERGLLAFKPSNGFLLRLREPMGGNWAPGMWWRFGKRLGIGGVTSAGEARAMADLLAMHMAREADPDMNRPDGGGTG